MTPTLAPATTPGVARRLEGLHKTRRTSALISDSEVFAAAPPSPRPAVGSPAPPALVGPWPGGLFLHSTAGSNSAAGLAAARHARMAVAEIAKLIRTTSAGIVQPYIAKPSKRGPCLAIFNWTRQMALERTAGVLSRFRLQIAAGVWVVDC